MIEKLFAIIAALMFIALMIWGITVQISVWKECRAEHSYWYCIQLMRSK